MSFKLSSLSLAILSSISLFQLAYASTIRANKEDITIEDGLIDHPKDSIAVLARDGYKLTVDDSEIQINAKYQGSQATANGFIFIGSSDTEIVTISTSNTTRNSPNITRATVYSDKGGSSIINGKQIFLNALASSELAANGAFAQGGSIQLGSDSFTETVYINNQGNSEPDDGGGFESSGLIAYNKGSSITVHTKNLVIDSSGVGLFVLSGTQETQPPSNSASIQINADHTEINAQDTGIRAFSNGQISITGGVTINAPTAFDVRGNSTVKINTSQEGTVQINGDIAFETPGPAGNSGDIINANVDIYLTGSDSYWNGNAYQHYARDIEDDEENTNTKVTGLHVTLADSAQWTPTIITDSTEGDTILKGQALNDLTLNGGVINLTQGSDQKVLIEETRGTGGTVNLSTTTAPDGTLTAAILDFGAIDGTPALAVNYTGITADDVKSGNLADIKGGITSTEGSSFTQTKFVEQGAVKGAITETYNEKGEFVSRTVAENTRLDAYGSVAALSIMQWRHEMNDLTKRMGDLRTSPQGVGSWARIYGSEQEYGSQNLTAKNTSVQIGADTDIGNGWKVGAAFTYTDGSADYDLGDADNKAYGLGVYGTWMADNGQFVDLIAKYSRLDTDFKLEGMNGSSDNNAFSVSAEYGWHLRLGEFGFFEPQAEVTYGYIQGDKFHTSNGVEIDQDDFESLIGRIGFRTGFHFPKDKGLIYARVSGLHDFKGDFDSAATLMSDRSIYDNIGEDLGDTWVEFGIGANFNWTPNTYTYVDLERTNGGDVKENWRWNIGLRHVF